MKFLLLLTAGTLLNVLFILGEIFILTIDSL
jgi:hypothetical protein